MASTASFEIQCANELDILTINRKPDFLAYLLNCFFENVLTCTSPAVQEVFVRMIFQAGGAAPRQSTQPVQKGGDCFLFSQPVSPEMLVSAKK